MISGSIQTEPRWHILHQAVPPFFCLYVFAADKHGFFWINLGEGRSEGFAGGSRDLNHSKSLWVCLKMGYTPNCSHLVGIMISKTIGFRGTNHFQTNPYRFSMTNSPRTQNPFDILLVVKPVGAHLGDLAKASEHLGHGHFRGEEFLKNFGSIFSIYHVYPCILYIETV